MPKRNLPDTLICDSCGSEFPRPQTRGRPPKSCVPCREKPKAVAVKDILEGKQRVDALDLMLKSRGTHLSQQKEKW